MKIVVLTRGIAGRKWHYVREEDIAVHPAEHERTLNGGMLSDEAVMARPVRKEVFRVEPSKGWWKTKAKRGTSYVGKVGK